jgi:hypothetical protein
MPANALSILKKTQSAPLTAIFLHVDHLRKNATIDDAIARCKTYRAFFANLVIGEGHFAVAVDGQEASIEFRDLIATTLAAATLFGARGTNPTPADESNMAMARLDSDKAFEAKTYQIWAACNIDKWDNALKVFKGFTDEQKAKLAAQKFPNGEYEETILDLTRQAKDQHAQELHAAISTIGKKSLRNT